MTGSAIAIPLLGATGASAADGATWDRVAECETGGSWSQNTGNGYYGGLQFTQEDWEAYGGLDFASSADRASRSQQIAVGERLLADRGPDAWPTCGLLAALDGGTGDAGVDPGVPESPVEGGIPDDARDEPSASPPASSDETVTDSPDAADEAGDGGSDSGTPDDAGASPAPGGSTDPIQQDDSDKSGQGDGSSADAETGETGTGRHRGPGSEEGAGDGRGDGSSGRHASRDAAGARDTGDGIYTVRPGDSLWAIADSLDLEGGWPGLYTANRETVGDDPDLILPGQKLAVQGESVEK